jgi:predicted PurR-regulated permease PerM
VNSQPARRDVPSVRAVLRVIVTVALSGLALYLMYLVREPLSWLLIAMFVAVAASGPVTLGAVIVGVVTLFSDFPTTRIIWAIFAIAYQQFENNVVQPRIQSRAVSLDPFIVVIAAIFGGTLLGVIGALLAIPSGRAIQIAIRECLDYRREHGSRLEPG